MQKPLRVIAIAIASAFSSASAPRADVKLPAIFANHMVLQEGRKVPFFGSADPGEAITVSIGEQKWQATAGKDGRFRVDVGPLERRTPFAVTVQGKNRVSFDDVVTGEVWVASGQSNMEWTLIAAQNGEAEVQAATLPNLRLFHVEKPNQRTLADRPVPVNGKWLPATPQSAIYFSAVGYFFGRDLVRRLDRPIGIIHSSWGGTPAETWTSRKALGKHPLLRHLLDPLKKRPSESALAEYDRAVAEANARAPQDPGNRGHAEGWAKPFAGPSAALDWRPVQAPGAWEDAAGLDADGVVWLRRELELPAALRGQELLLRLGAIDRCDTTYVNDEQVGATCNEVRAPERTPRLYPVPARLTKTGRVTIAVRVFDNGGKGGLLGPAASMRLVLGPELEGPSVSLAGEWRYRVEHEVPGSFTPVRLAGPAGMITASSPGYLYDNMLADLIPYGIAGAIWYQGESNTKRAFQYRTLLSTMIDDWRDAWAQGAFPFLIVQLANFHPRFAGSGQRSEDEWAELREAQALVAAKHPNVGLAVTIDIGERSDIHPTNKQEVGRRLALVAAAKVYGLAVEHTGPVFAGQTIEKEGGTSRVRLRFQHATGLSVAGPPGERLFGFEVAGADRRYVSAEARIEGETVVLTASTVTRPVAARYAWSDDPLANLTNAAGLPAIPFRTDTWPGLTVGRK
jgi:sialate O-acetylesterase